MLGLGEVSSGPSCACGVDFRSASAHYSSMPGGMYAAPLPEVLVCLGSGSGLGLASMFVCSKISTIDMQPKV